ncbi:MAG: hypothetical protein EOO01_22070, partial [Chitinophagaceae bacterium]
MKKQLQIPNLAFLGMMAIAVAGTKLHAASNIKATEAGPSQMNAKVYEKVLNPYIKIKTDQRAVGNTYAVRDQQGRIIKTGVVDAAKICSVATGKLICSPYHLLTRCLLIDPPVPALL